MTSSVTDPRAARRELLRRRRQQAGSAPAAVESPGKTHASTNVVSAGLGVAERRMWRIHRLDTASVSHNITLVLSCRGVTAEQLVEGVEATVRGAEVLGSVIVDDDRNNDDNAAAGTPRRVPREASGQWIVPGTRWGLGVAGPGTVAGAGAVAGASTTESDGGTAAEVAAHLARTPFDLTAELPIRAWVDGSTLVLSVHHLAVDDTSWPLLIGAILAGRWPGPQPDTPAGPAGAAGATGASVEASPERVERAVAHARRTWAVEGIRFPLTRQLPDTTAEDSWLAPVDEAPGAQLRRDLDPTDLAAFAAFAPTVGGTPNAALVALCAVSTAVLTGAEDLVIAVPADNRRPGQPPDRVGYCGNIIPIRFTFDSSGTTEQAMRDSVAAIYAAMEFTDVDFGPILTALRSSGGRFPVMEVMASVRPSPMRHIETPPDVEVDYRSVSSGIAPYPLTLAIELAGPSRAHLEVDYQHGTGEDVAERAADVVSDLLHRIPTDGQQPLSSLIDALTHPRFRQ
ncbi:hypothetical protein NCCP2495_16680 [Dietzia sp. NCCP-2495]|uniref:peptide synthetase n=1 Tax=Dietzia sp. NCCP-2495 TaxID=2934675 RepID=UPI0022312BB7|nr:peptide synthetase [Dietzia sp. NCCP-2495]GLB63789.1 hypothetical protein NCCP2495_16680 [Dietzia sp. NCCP-2495]